MLTNFPPSKQIESCSRFRWACSAVLDFTIAAAIKSQNIHILFARKLNWIMKKYILYSPLSASLSNLSCSNLVATPCCKIYKYKSKRINESNVKKINISIENSSQWVSTTWFRFNAHLMPATCYANAKCFATEWRDINFEYFMEQPWTFSNPSKLLQYTCSHLKSGTVEMRNSCDCRFGPNNKIQAIAYDAIISIYWHSTYHHERKGNRSFFFSSDFSVLVEETYFWNQNNNKQFRFAQLTVCNALAYI